ncbi:hypothetical protein [Mycolicibacterium baixiangningiae]|uniref:hypothetical protein n=1 Tax=Mycolicibacterium baixiangningiae TaxID=2761578 RepID=UPI0018D1A165|nr:hypothetical protein [Mycolicibacterium baixiangningiae]
MHETTERHARHQLARNGRLQVFVAVAVAVAAFWCWWAGWRGSRPFEDAAILFRYADNVAAGHGIVWNVGEAPVDGATDLGFMLVLAAVGALGVGADIAALIVNSAAFVAIAAGLFVFARRRNLPLAFAALVTALFVFSPAVTLIQAGFGAVFFSAAVAVAAIAMFRLTDDPTPRNAGLLALAGVVAGLIRPEGFIFAGMFIVTAVVVAGRPLLRAALVAASLVAVAGFAFVLWRWMYFGSPLPNPYYKKGGGTLHLDGLKDSLRFAATVGAVPFSLVFMIGALGGFGRRWFAYLGCTGVLLAMWLLLSSEMNYNYRFQFPVLVMVLTMAIDLGAREYPHLRSRLARVSASARWVVPLLVAAVVAGQFLADQYRFTPPDTEASHEDVIPRILSGTGRQDLVLATTESGYACWRSGWTCIDLWGLNDKEIAHHGYLNEDRLAELDPDVILVHAPTSPTASSISVADGFLPGWEEMTDPVIRFAEGGDYVLAAVLSPQEDSGYVVYVRPGESWSDGLIAEFGNLEPSVEEFYGPRATVRPALPTNP